jgi:DNA-binding transcriptional regulator GbsR (MarR family)
MEKIYKIFSNLVSTLGYSRVHTSILTTLFIHKELSLKELAKNTKYSLSSISLSLDLLELIGLIKKYRKDKSKEVYVRLEGDLLLALKELVLMKINKGINTALGDLEKEKKEGAKKIKREILRFKKYVDALNKVEIPKD